MFRNRLLYVLVTLGLLVLLPLTLRAAIATSAVVTSGSRPYEEVERIRSERDAAMSADNSYSEVERIRSQRGETAAADNSYNEVERIRSQRDAVCSTQASYDEVETGRAIRPSSSDIWYTSAYFGCARYMPSSAPPGK